MTGGDQERVDFFYDLVCSGEWEALAGRGAREILALLGPPAEIWALDHQGHRWHSIVYRFDAVPSRATGDEREAHQRGMRFAPSLLFRDGVSVGPERFRAEVLGGKETAGPPAGIEWRREESFP